MDENNHHHHVHTTGTEASGLSPVEAAEAAASCCPVWDGPAGQPTREAGLRWPLLASLS